MSTRRTLMIILGALLLILCFVSCTLENTAVHAVVDHAKANLGVLNLVEDQTIHMVQIVLTLLVLAL